MHGVPARDAQQRQVKNEILYDLMEAIFAPIVARGTLDLRWNSPLEVSDYIFCVSQLGLQITWKRSSDTAFNKISGLSARFEQNS